MDYKQKYEQAIENFKRIKNANRDNKELVDFIEYQYPTLKESEDEKIRRWIINYLDNKAINSGIIQEKTNIKNAIAWLEKKGEQKPANYSVWVGGSEVNDNYLTKEEAEKLAGKYKKDDYEDVAIEKIEQKPAEWSDYDECMLTNLIEDTRFGIDIEYIDWLKSLKQRMKGE